MRFKLNGASITLNPVRYIGKEVVIGDLPIGIGVFLRGENAEEIAREMREALDHCQLKLIGEGSYMDVDYIRLEENNGGRRSKRDDLLRGLEDQEIRDHIQGTLEHWGPKKAYPKVAKTSERVQILTEKGA